MQSLSDKVSHFEHEHKRAMKKIKNLEELIKKLKNQMARSDLKSAAENVELDNSID